MHITNIHDAKTQLSRLVERAASGEEIIIAKSGKPMAKLIAYNENKQPRKPGLWKGKVKIQPDFDELPDEVKRAFSVTSS